MSQVNILIDEDKLKQLVYDYIKNLSGALPVTKDDIKIEVKSKQNYKSEWEVAAFRATVYISTNL